MVKSPCGREHKYRSRGGSLNIGAIANRSLTSNPVQCTGDGTKRNGTLVGSSKVCADIATGMVRHRVGRSV